MLSRLEWPALRRCSSSSSVVLPLGPSSSEPQQLLFRLLKLFPSAHLSLQHLVRHQLNSFSIMSTSACSHMSLASSVELSIATPSWIAQRSQKSSIASFKCFRASSRFFPQLSQKAKQPRRTCPLIVAAEKQTTATETQDVVVDHNILPYCDINKSSKKSIGELEQDFLLALQAYYQGEEAMMSDEEFEILKEELTWEGSSVVVLTTEEQKFLEALMAYKTGKPFMSDAEFDQLKLQLKKQGSKVAIEGPRCSLRSRKVYSDTTVDYLRMTLLNLPAAIIALLLVFFVDDLTGFEITYLLELPEPYSFLFTWFIVLPFTFLTAQFITNLALKDFLILRGPCPNCGVNNISFFGTIFTVSNSQRVNDVKCESCGSLLKYELDARIITLEPTPPPAAPPKVPKKVAATT